MICARSPTSRAARYRHLCARFPECPAAGASRESRTLAAAHATTGTVRAPCAICRETVGISATGRGTFPQVRAHFRWSQQFLRYVRNAEDKTSPTRSSEADDMKDRERRGRATANPASIPDDLDDAGIEKATGIVELPLHIRWSGPPRTYDLSDRQQLARVHEQVLQEGTEDDVRHFVRSEDLIDLWDELVLPPRVSRAWAKWLKTHRGVTVEPR